MPERWKQGLKRVANDGVCWIASIVHAGYQHCGLPKEATERRRRMPFRIGPIELIILLSIILVAVGVTVLITLVIIRLVRGRITPRSPLDIAKTRYAKGEITEEEFDLLKKDLS